jgi:sterol desaturase/sphingolipid hydroxylase (fatty acid hydroxylase superfamily)
MDKYLEIIQNAYSGYFKYFVSAVLQPHWHNHFYWLIGASIVIYGAERLFPWRKNQPAIRQDFWIDAFYLLWNYFLFSLVAYSALSSVFVELFKDFLGLFGITNVVALHIEELSNWWKLLIVFVLRDFMQWNIHRLLHNVSWMWEFHKVHHSVEEMGFAALLRYHFMENIIYRSLEYLPLAMIGFGLHDFFIVHMFTLITGQLGHANLYLPMGKLQFLLNGPQMHLWHHAKEFPESHPRGYNYGITLSVWDYLFKTNYFPRVDKDVPVGLSAADAAFPRDFVGQMVEPFKKAFGRK